MDDKGALVVGMVPTAMASGSRRQVGGRQRYTGVCILSETHTVPRPVDGIGVFDAGSHQAKRPNPLTLYVPVSVGSALPPGPAGCVGTGFQGCQFRFQAMVAAFFIDNPYSIRRPGRAKASACSGVGARSRSSRLNGLVSVAVPVSPPAHGQPSSPGTCGGAGDRILTEDTGRCRPGTGARHSGRMQLRRTGMAGVVCRSGT